MEEQDINLKKIREQVPVHHNEEPLSPFVIRLSPWPSPEELLSKRQETEALDFLFENNESRSGETVFVTKRPAKEDDERELQISVDELAAQLQEDVSMDEPGIVELEATKPVPSARFFSKGSLHTAGVFALLAIAMILPLKFLSYAGELREAKAKVASEGVEALSTLGTAAQSIIRQDISGASESFSRATEQFGIVHETISDLGSGTSFLLSIIPQTKKAYKTSRYLLRAGEAISKAGSRLADGLSTKAGAADKNLAIRLSTFSSHAASALPLLVEATSELSRVDPSSIPDAYGETFHELASRLPVVVDSLKKFLEFSDMALHVMGANGEKRYLIVFQNNTEIRPTGGFMGSFAEITLKDGAITSMNIPRGGTYDLDGSVRTPLAAPKPMQLISEKWEFRDANWFPDFPTSARKIMNIYENAGGSTVDGVIAVNATFVASLLDLLGPISMPDYRRTFDSQNFLGEAQKIVELEYNREENKPKAFIADLADILLDQTAKKTGDEFFRLFDVINRGLNEREIQIYFSRDTLESRVRSLGWGGEMKRAEGDALMIVNTNLGGGKTDGVIKENIVIDVTIDPDGTVTDTVTISRKHFGVPHALFTGMNNVNYVRLYVPNGSTLISASGFAPPDDLLFKKPASDWMTDADVDYGEESASKDAASNTDIFEENGRTVFGNWTQTKPGTETKTVFSYRLPQKIAPLKNINKMTQRMKTALGIPRIGSYTLSIQKQAGVMDRTSTVHLKLPDNVTLLWSSDDISKAVYTNKTDTFFSALLEYRHPASL